MHTTPRKICFAASAGGHLNQVLQVAKHWQGDEIVFVTTLQLASKQLAQQGKTYVIGECNRQHLLRVARVLARCLRIASKERFDVVVSTGAAPGLLMCLAARLWRARVVWIDSIANVERLSLSGRLVQRWADLVITQWPGVAADNPRVEYLGTLL